MTAIAILLKKLGADLKTYVGEGLPVVSPIDGSLVATLKVTTLNDVDKKIELSSRAFLEWREVPAPKRGELIRLLGNELRDHKDELAQLVTIECGKILAESLGEVQEMIDICEFAVGLSRQLYGLTIASERRDHRMQESWLPLGPVAVISAFNFPVAVWAWNFCLAIVCGDAVIWKPSEKTPVTAIACQSLFLRALKRYKTEGGDCPANISQLLIGRAAVGERLVSNHAICLVSATGSSRMGKEVSQIVARRFGKSLLELGGNNAVIVSEKADLKLAHDAVVFGAVGTAGQRCTTTRRVFIHESIFTSFVGQLKKSYASIASKKIGNPCKKSVLVGPLIDANAFKAMQAALKQATAEGGEVFFGKRVDAKTRAMAFYVEPALVVMKKQSPVVRIETFAPILYAIPYKFLKDAIGMQNDVPQGLSSAIFTKDIGEAELFRSRSDCGIANVNIGTSGAEIGGAFGGEKETGGGRESGSDAWKNYMRRQTSTLYFGDTPPALAQGISFDVK